MATPPIESEPAAMPPLESAYRIDSAGLAIGLIGLLIAVVGASLAFDTRGEYDGGPIVIQVAVALFGAALVLVGIGLRVAGWIQRDPLRAKPTMKATRKLAAVALADPPDLPEGSPALMANNSEAKKWAVWVFVLMFFLAVLVSVVAALVYGLASGGTDDEVKLTPSSACARVVPEMISAYRVFENAPAGSKAESDALSALRASQLESEGYRC